MLKLLLYNLQKMKGLISTITYEDYNFNSPILNHKCIGEIVNDILESCEWLLLSESIENLYIKTPANSHKTEYCPLNSVRKIENLCTLSFIHNCPNKLILIKEVDSENDLGILSSIEREVYSCLETSENYLIIIQLYTKMLYN